MIVGRVAEPSGNRFDVFDHVVGCLDLRRCDPGGQQCLDLGLPLGHGRLQPLGFLHGGSLDLALKELFAVLYAGRIAV